MLAGKDRLEGFSVLFSLYSAIISGSIYFLYRAVFSVKRKVSTSFPGKTALILLDTIKTALYLGFLNHYSLYNCLVLQIISVVCVGICVQILCCKSVDFWIFLTLNFYGIKLKKVKALSKLLPQRPAMRHWLGLRGSDHGFAPTISSRAEQTQRRFSSVHIVVV
jgi:hypothetical protein